MQIKPRNEAGNVVKPFDWNLLDNILKYRTSLEDCSAMLGVSEDTVQRRIKEKYDVTFATYRNKMIAPVRISLVQKAIKMAIEGGNTAMVIFCLKNLCGWQDKLEVNDPDIKDRTINIKLLKDDKDQTQV